MTCTGTRRAATPASLRSPTMSPAPPSPTVLWPTVSPTTIRSSPIQVPTRPATRRPRPARACPDGFPHYHQVVPHPSANEACHAAPTPCQSVTLGCTPATPTGLTATAVSASQVQLYWSAGGGNADHYEIQRAKTHGGPFSTVTSNVSGTSFTDTTALGDSTYIYRVRAVCSGNYSNFSSTDIATTVIFIDDPLVPGVLIKAEHMGQLSRGVDGMRGVAPL